MDTFEAYKLVAKTYQEYQERYDAWSKKNPYEKVEQDLWIASVVITDLLVAQGKLDKIYAERI